MKPTEQQVREWIAQIKSDSGEAYTQDLCELAAKWGAEQAQHAAENAPWLTTAHVICTDEGVAHGSISERLEALRDKLADKAQQTTEETDAEMALRSIASWLGVGGFNAPAVDAKVFERKIYEGVEMAIKSHYVAAEEPELPEASAVVVGTSHLDGRVRWYKPNSLGLDLDTKLYTAVQMHDHFQAGVRAGMAQQSQDAKRYRFIRDNIYRLPYDDHGAGPEFDLSEEAIDSAMQGGQK